MNDDGPKDLGGLIGGLDIGKLVNRTDEEWAANDAKIEADRLAEEARFKERERAAIQQRLLAGGAPELIVEGIYGGTFDDGTGAATCLSGFEDDDRRIRILSGGVGCGKTWAAVRWLGDHGGLSPMFLRCSAFEAAGRYDKELRRAWQTCSALVLDDLGAEYQDGKGNLMADLDELFDTYSTRKARLIVTTNIDPTDFKARYSARILSRLRESARWKSSNEADRRVGK